MQTARLETFSDGVFAIAATLLILDVNLPPDHGSLVHGLAELWPSYAAYAVSFVTIGVMWINHHAVFDLIDRADRTLLAISVLFLMVIAFVPFPTRVLAEHLHDSQATTAAIFYGLTMVAMSLMYLLLWFYAAIGRRLIRADADQRVVSGITRAFIPGLPSWGIATLTALISSWIAVTLFAALTLFYVLESSLLGRRET